MGVILFEPQWGSSQAGLPWPKSLLKKFMEMAKAVGIGVVADEIMCGLGRHGQGALFASTSWNLDPDALTFGKAIGGGVYPIAGAVLKQGRKTLSANGCTVMQSHTYAGSSVRALMTATEVLREIKRWLPSVAKLGDEMSHIFRYLAKVSNGLILTHGQGLMWGGLFTKEGQMSDTTYRNRAFECFRKQCQDLSILPYIVPAGGFMVTPLFDTDVGTIYEMGQKLEGVLVRTMVEIGGLGIKATSQTKGTDMSTNGETMTICPGSECQAYSHQTKSCTSCSSFVCPNVRMRFVM